MFDYSIPDCPPPKTSREMIQENSVARKIFQFQEVDGDEVTVKAVERIWYSPNRGIVCEMRVFFDEDDGTGPVPDFDQFEPAHRPAAMMKYMLTSAMNAKGSQIPQDYVVPLVKKLLLVGKLEPKDHIKAVARHELKMTINMLEQSAPMGSEADRILRTSAPVDQDNPFLTLFQLYNILEERDLVVENVIIGKDLFEFLKKYDDENNKEDDILKTGVYSPKMFHYDEAGNPIYINISHHFANLYITDLVCASRKVFVCADPEYVGTFYWKKDSLELVNVLKNGEAMSYNEFGDPENKVAYTHEASIVMPSAPGTMYATFPKNILD